MEYRKEAERRATRTMLHALCSGCLQLRRKPPGFPFPLWSQEPPSPFLQSPKDWQQESGTPLDSYQFLYGATELFVCYIAGVQGYC